MYCTNCGHQNIDAAQFCTNCGGSLSGSTGVPKPVINYNPTQINKKRFEVSKIFLVLLYVMLGLFIIGAIGIWATSGGDGGSFVRLIINWLLGVIFGLSVFGLIGGVIAGAVLLIKANDNKADQGYYRRNALWCFLGPIMVMVAIIFGYVIINVVANLVAPVVTGTGLN